MQLTLDEIIQHEERLQQEIVERECLLAAFKVLHSYAASGKSAPTMELGVLGRILTPAAPEMALLAAATVPTEPTPAPALPAPKRYIHPELEAISKKDRKRNGLAIAWSIQRMTGNYSVGDLAALLRREGYSLSPAEISVIVTRMKKRGEIEEVSLGRGRRGSVFRKAAAAADPGTICADETKATVPFTMSAAAA